MSTALVFRRAAERLTTFSGSVRKGRGSLLKVASMYQRFAAPAGATGRGTQAHVLSAAHVKGICGAKARVHRSKLLLARTASCGNLNHF